MIATASRRDGSVEGPTLRGWEQPRGTLRLCEEYHLPCTDAPREHNIACGLAVHAALVGHQVWIPFGGQRLGLNLWALVLGPSSDFRKSTTVNQARRTIRALYDGAPESAPSCRMSSHARPSCATSANTHKACSPTANSPGPWRPTRATT